MPGAPSPAPEGFLVNVQRSDPLRSIVRGAQSQSWVLDPPCKYRWLIRPHGRLPVLAGSAQALDTINAGRKPSRIQLARRWPTGYCEFADTLAACLPLAFSAEYLQGFTPEGRRLTHFSHTTTVAPPLASFNCTPVLGAGFSFVSFILASG